MTDHAQILAFVNRWRAALDLEPLAVLCVGEPEDHRRCTLALALRAQIVPHRWPEQTYANWMSNPRFAAWYWDETKLHKLAGALGLRRQGRTMILLPVYVSRFAFDYDRWLYPELVERAVWREAVAVGHPRVA